MEAIVKTDRETGLIIGKCLTVSSGFDCLEGFRNFGRLTIREGVLKGTGSIFLTNISLFDENQILILDIAFEKLTSYSREKVRKTVLNLLITMLNDAAAIQNKQIDQDEVFDLLNNQLKMVYYEESYKSITQWAEDIGISMS